MAIRIEVAADVTPELVEAFARLIPQLSRSARVPDHAELAEIIGSPATDLLVARNGDGDGDGQNGPVVGALTLVVFRIPTGLRAWIEDVVVDESARGMGAAKALSQEAVARATALGARSVDLTSRPSREAANRLYQRLGFVQRETNVYRYDADAG